MTRRITRQRVAKVRAAMEQALGNIPGTGTGTTSNTTPDPVGAMVCAGPDQAQQDLDDLDRLQRIFLRRAGQRLPVTRTVRALDDLLRRWELNDWQQNNIRAAADGRGEDGCTSCARLPGIDGRPKWSERHPGLAVCRQCYDDLRRVRAIDGHETDGLPPLELLRWRERWPGKRLSAETLARIARS